MEFSINIDKQLLGKIVVTDLTNDYNEYIDENSTIQNDEENPFKFSETVSLNAIIRMTTKEATLIDVLLGDHSFNTDLQVFNPDTFEFVAKKDGYYTITHFILPNELWMENTYPIVRNNYKSDDPNLNGAIYYMKSNGTLWKRVYNPITGAWPAADGSEDVEASVKEILEANISNSPIAYCKVDMFYDGFLRECYINICEELFAKYMQGCTPNCQPKDVDTYSRDFLHMTLHIIEYLTELGEFMEAQRILEQINYCGGFCKNVNNENSGCGCSPKRSSCGCSQA